jgi:orotidine-5'-phosphate decarboxylase
VDDSKKIIVALDYDNLDSVTNLINSIDPELCRIKIGKELFTKYGPSIV